MFSHPKQIPIQTTDEKIYVGCGPSSGSATSYLIRLNSDGTFDSTFTEINLNGAIHSIIQTVDGNIYFAGEFNTVIGLPDATSVARLHSTGILDTSYTGPSYGRFFAHVYNLNQTADGKIYVSTA